MAVRGVDAMARSAARCLHHLGCRIGWLDTTSTGVAIVFPNNGRDMRFPKIDMRQHEKMKRLF